ncbi:S-adenosyl-L-methionine-dependent methyltransferase [Lophiostoma macrostomum CBS 122681]|uniref:S-adenosyl-L-methionine-dependent methyltransferase n=1 Tax=Lophiostoma macrostomum CBS 122681 TaxID=1314788 RepID=A0A6A6T752_9PLEO|nr:S-adenosyl-L-methionine-dependent methyltransferase [Lophiostoma macrostomum CBS 122681]
MTLSISQYEALAQQIETMLVDLEGTTEHIGDEETRHRLVEGASKLAIRLEDPRETLRRTSFSHLQLPLAIVGVETKLFSILAAEDRPFHITELTDATGVDKSLLERLLRYYQATGMIAQVDDESFRATNVTRSLSDSDHADSLRWIMYWHVANCLSSAIHTDLPPFEWLAANPWAWQLAQVHMKAHRKGRPTFFDALDFEKRFAQDATSSTVLLVDIGGGTGSQTRTFRQRFPDLPGRVIVQDRPEVIANVKDDLEKANIEAEVYDMFKPQPIKGARVYYLRNIFQAWTDATGKDILLNAKAGLTDQSIIMIDEMVLPKRGARVQGAQHDMEVMAAVAGIERTKDQWEQLLNSAGLKMHEVVNYDEHFEDSVIIAGLN